MTVAIVWSYRCYKNATGRNQITSHLTGLTVKGRMQLRRTLEHLRTKPETLWIRPHASPAGNHIYVIRFHDENRTQHRLFGHHEASFAEFVITLYGVEKDRVYEPSDYLRICATRRGECASEPDKHKCSCLPESATVGSQSGNVFPIGNNLAAMGDGGR